MSHHLTLLQVHAHPDDESSKGAGTNALYASRGVRCVLVCCTGGEEGEILNPGYGTPERLMAELRKDELEAATRILGYSAVHMLGYEDSGMADSRANENPACFARAPLRHAVGRLVKILRDERPDVVVTYPPSGGYPHPDHIRVHEVTMAAIEAAPDPSSYEEAGPPHTVSKVYYAARSRERMVAMAEAYERLGIEYPFRARMRDDDRGDEITAKIDVGEFFQVRQDALLAHATQVSPDSFWTRLPLEVARQAYPYEDYTLAASTVAVRPPESDLFSGIPG